MPEHDLSMAYHRDMSLNYAARSVGKFHAGLMANDRVMVAACNNGLFLVEDGPWKPAEVPETRRCQRTSCAHLWAGLTTCDECGRARTPEDKDYDPMQLIHGQAVGWYSGKDGELCGADLQKLFDKANA